MRDNFFEKYNVHPENQKIILEVLNSMRLEGKTEITVLGYGQILRKYFTDVQKLVSQISYDDVLDWLERRYGGKNPGTYLCNLEVLKSFFKKCKRLEYIEEIPVKSWWAPRIGGSIPKYLTDKEISEIKMQAENLPLRNRLIVELLFGIGIRVSELCKIEICNIDLDNGQLKIKGKGRKERELELSYDTIMLIRKYLEQHKGKSKFLFPSPKKEHLSSRRVQAILKKLGKELPNPRNLTPHMFRHSFATQKIKKGYDIEDIKGDMGHSYAQTTFIYAVIPRKEFINTYHRIAG